MKKSLKQLGDSICNFEDPRDISDADIDAFLSNTCVALAVGGKGQRLESVTNGFVNKNALVVDVDGNTMVERVIRMYKAAGITKFIALVFTHSDSIVEALGDGSRFGVEVVYSSDPGRQVGRGGAILNALVNSSIPESYNLIVHNPCDQIVDNDSFVREIVRSHLFGLCSGHIATAIVTRGTPYTFTGMKITNSKVENIEMYPHIPVPAHIGVTVFSPQVYSYFRKLFSLEEKVDFEQVLFPVLAEEGKLYAHGVNNDSWIAVKDPKGLQKLRDKLGFKDD